MVADAPTWDSSQAEKMLEDASGEGSGLSELQSKLLLSENSILAHGLHHVA